MSAGRISLMLVAMAVWPASAPGQDLGQNLGQDNLETEQADAAETEMAEPMAPILRQSLSAEETVPGQPVTLTLTVLVPSYLPQPPVWPDYQRADLIVRPISGRGATSERIGSETWSGVIRRYTIAPMVARAFALPAQEVTITWADPDTNETRSTIMRTEPVEFAGVIPEGAEGLDPFLAATSLDLAQEIEGNPASMAPGDSAARSITATIQGTSPILLPPLLPPVDIAGLALYPDEPSLVETADGGAPGGTRRERMAIVAEGRAGGRMPDIEIAWFNLETGTVETAVAEGFDVVASGPAVRKELQAAQLARWLGAAAALGLAVLLGRRLAPALRRRLERWRAHRLASEAHAYREVTRAVRARHHAGFRRALDLWAVRVTGQDPRSDPTVERALLALGAARYRTLDGAAQDETWTALRLALSAARHRQTEPTVSPDRLPPLNPAA